MHPTALSVPTTPGRSQKAVFGFVRRWQERLGRYRQTIDDLTVDIADPHRISIAERTALATRIRHTNMAIYRCEHPGEAGPDALLALATQLGLGRPERNLCADDYGLSRIQVEEGSPHQRYIPYTSRRLNWHTDGYYHTADRIIRTMLLHCVRPALQGGALEAIDHEIVYGLLLGQDPRLVEALSQPDAMTIPENNPGGSTHRAECQGPVFFWDAGVLRMRYTARKHNVTWKHDTLTREGAAALEEILNGSGDLIVRRRLRSGEGLVCANVPHRREAFSDSEHSEQTRLVYRGRYTKAQAV